MPTSFVPLFPGMPGGPEMIVILLIVVLLFGANKLPKLARSSGQAMGEFKKGREEIEDELQDIRDGGTMDDDTSFERDQNQGQSQPQHSQTQNQPPQGQRGQNQNQGQEQHRSQNQRSEAGQSQSSGQSSANEWGSPATNKERDRR